MNWLKQLLSRRRHYDELSESIREHLNEKIADLMNCGMTREEAERAAHREFGNVTRIEERSREVWQWPTLESICADLKYAIRQLWKSPVFTATCILILALGIGAVTAVFSLIDAALLRMLPVRNPEQLVQFKAVSPALPVGDTFSYPAFKAFRQQTKVFDGVLGFRELPNIDFEIDGHRALAEGQLVSGDYFSVLGVKAIVGRTILPVDESASNQNPVAVIGYDYWRSRFELDPGIVGKKIRLNDSLYTIIGVTEPEFYGVQPGERIDVSVPLTTVSLINPGLAGVGKPYEALKAPFQNWLFVMGRLHPGITEKKATASLQPMFAQLERDAAAGLTGLPYDSPTIRQALLQFKLRLDPASQGLADLREQFSKPLWVVMAIVGLLLLITCANVANLLLARANAREREIAVRLAMGAGKGRVLRQLITESILLGVTGGAFGAGLAYLGSHSLLALIARGRNPIVLSVHPDLAVLAFAITVSLLTALLFGSIPAWRATYVNPSCVLVQSTRGSDSGGERYRLSKSLTIFQVSISLMLLIGAGLLTHSLVNLKNFYPGFNRDNVLLISVNPSVIGYKDVVSLYQRMLGAIGTIPGVRSASLSVHEPLTTNGSSTNIKVQGSVLRQGEDLTSVDIEPIGPDYFRSMETPVLRGREFTAADRVGSPKVAIVNESIARHYFGDADPIGKQVSIPGYRSDPSWLQIIGEVRDVKVHDLRESATFMLYVPMFQAPEGEATFEIRTAMRPEYAETSMLDAIKTVDSSLPVDSVKSLNDQLDDSLVEQRLVALLSELFGLLALILTCVGLYGLMTYTVSRRSGEIGIRMALGAQRGRIAWMIFRETMLLVACGLAIGIPAAAITSRLIANQLFGLKSADFVTFLAASAIMVVVSVVASLLPAHRAASVDPMRALRSE